MSTPAPTRRATRRTPEWTFADRIRKIRRDILEMEQAEMAAKLDVTRAAYAAWESGRTEPRSILTLAKKVELLSGVPVGWLLGLGPDGSGGNLETERETNQYPTATRRSQAALSLVKEPATSNSSVASRTGSWSPADGQDGGADVTHAAEWRNLAYSA